MSYLFRREDNDCVIEVCFEKMMEQDASGYITLSTGVQARRCVHLEMERDGTWPPKDRVSDLGNNKPIVSDALGFTEYQLAEFEADRVKHGFTGIEFKRDPTEPTFFQAHISSQAEKDRYVKHRGLLDNNSRNGGGVALTPQQLEAAIARAKEKYPGSELAPIDGAIS